MSIRIRVLYLAMTTIATLTATYWIAPGPVRQMSARALESLSAKLSRWQLSTESRTIDDSRQAYEATLADRKAMDENLRMLQGGRNALRMRLEGSEEGASVRTALVVELARYEEAITAVSDQLARLDRQLENADGTLALRADENRRRELMLESNRLTALAGERLRAIGLPPVVEKAAAVAAGDSSGAAPAAAVTAAADDATRAVEPAPAVEREISVEMEAPGEVQGHTALVKAELVGDEKTTDEFWLGVIPAAAPSSVWAQGIKLRRGVNSRYVYVGRAEEPNDAGAYQVIVFRVPAGKILGEGEITLGAFDEAGAVELKSVMITRSR